MAKVTVVNNIFDIRDSKEYDVNKSISISDFLQEESLTEKNYSSLVECYDSDTGETTFVSIEDNIEKDMYVNVLVNGNKVEPDYIIKDIDVIIIEILPASEKAGDIAMIVAGGLLAIAGVVAIIASGGLGFLGGTVALNAIKWGYLGFGLCLGAVGGFLLMAGIDGLVNADSNSNQIQSDTGESNPNITGTENQPLGTNTFPLVIGSMQVTPPIIGSVYTEMIHSETLDRTWFGSKRKAYELLMVGYGPLYIDNIRFKQLVVSSNPNKVLSGIISQEKTENEIGAMWRSNKPVFEISQFGEHRTIYPFTVKQRNVGSTLLYCYDKMYQEISEQEVITWQGGTFPVGMRTNTIQFTDGVPYKIAVGIKFPNGLFRLHNDSSGNEIYTKIPMNLVVQWRPYYKYVKENDLDSKPMNADTYNYAEDGYGEGRYGKWRDFDDNMIVPKLTYTCADNEYKYYKEGNTPYVVNGYYGYYLHFAPASWGNIKNGSFVEVQKKMTAKECRDYLEKVYSEWLKTKYIYIVSPNDYIIIDGKTYYTTYHTGGNTSHWSESFHYYSPQEFAKRIYMDYYNNQDANFAKSHNNSSRTYSGTLVASREVALNLGLSEGTRENCNPSWNGVKAFSFGKCSCGVNAYNNADPSLTSDTITKKNIEGAKDEMEFELTATLTQEDILDLINRNPKSKKAGEIDVEGDSFTKLEGLTDVEIEGVQVRVIRLTPCYINKNKDSVSYSYNDIVQWSYIKTYCIDKEKLIKDIDNIEFGKVFPKINCNSDCYDETGTKEIIVPGHTEEGEPKKETVNVPALMEEEGSVRWNEWNIDDYRSKPLSEVDQYNTVTLGLEIEPDKLGYVSNNISQINVKASAITPALATGSEINAETKYGGFIRYIKEKNGIIYFCDRYENSNDVLDLTHISSINDADWNYASATVNADEYDDITEAVTIDIGTKDNCTYSYYFKQEHWDYHYFPEVIEPKYKQELVTDDNGDAVFKSEGVPYMELIKNDNNWFDYIKKEMTMFTNQGRYIASDSFLSTFINQNAISQGIGFMCGKSLGKDAYFYNTRGNDKYLRIWFEKDDDYYAYDTLIQDIPDNEEWENIIPDDEDFYKLAKSIFDDENPVAIPYSNSQSLHFYYSFRTVKSAFNPMTLKEAWEYTDKVNIGTGELSYKCNLYINSQQKVSNYFTGILNAGRAYWFYDEKGRYEIHNDKPLTNPVMLITDENCISSSNTRVFNNQIAGYHITYKDEENDYEQSELYVLREGQTKENHTRDIKDITLNGITNGKQAWAYGAYLLGQSITQRETWTRKLNHLGDKLTIGSLVEIQSFTLQIGTDTSGRILNLIEDDRYIYGFIADNMYEYKAEYNEDGTNKQGCKLLQGDQSSESTVVTVRFANRLQQEQGIPVTTDDGTVVYKNIKGQTNCVLFEKKIIKDLEKQESQTEDSETSTSLNTSFTPKAGDVIAFGNIGMITSKAVCYQLSADENGQVTASFYPYFDSLYTAGQSLPVYSANLTKKPIVNEIPVNDIDTYSSIKNEINNNNKNIDEKINSIEISSLSVTPTSQNISCDIDGNILDVYTPLRISCYVYKNNKIVEDVAYTVSVNGTVYGTFTTNDITLPINLFANNAINIIEVTAEFESTVRKVMATAVKVYQGADGTTPIVYSLELSDNAIHIDAKKNIIPDNITPKKIKTIDSYSAPTNYGNVYAVIDDGEEVKIGGNTKDITGVYSEKVLYQGLYKPFLLKVGINEKGENLYLTENKDGTNTASLFFERVTE